ncbi:hypothetical protein HDU87_006672 [Geranomyces variabilis]|uniref:Uncharacterized protein n=1 Tax=Geranomyces variabilis TaxID=109894 RepID=A0AAD5TEY7_9FUNG|nr:hypothetical protein HDU87_006672 [Geranomyces variabilis]
MTATGIDAAAIAEAESEIRDVRHLRAIAPFTQLRMDAQITKLRAILDVKYAESHAAVLKLGGDAVTREGYDDVADVGLYEKILVRGGTELTLHLAEQRSRKNEVFDVCGVGNGVKVQKNKLSWERRKGANAQQLSSMLKKRGVDVNR